MDNVEESQDTDYRRLGFIALQILAGLIAVLQSRSVWIEVSILDYRGTDDWYGKTVFVIGVFLVFTATVGLLKHISSMVLKWIQVSSLIAGIVGIAITSIVGLRVNQIAEDIGAKARAPERWFEGTILEGLGKVLANLSESISGVIQPKLTTSWKLSLVALVVATIAVAIQIPWSEFKSTPNEDEDLP